MLIPQLNLQLIIFSTGILPLQIDSDFKSSDNDRSYSYPKLTFGFVYAEKLVLQMKNGLSSSRYRPAEHKRLQALIDAERLECDLMGQKVCFVVIYALKQQSRCTFFPVSFIKTFQLLPCQTALLNIDLSPCSLENCSMFFIG